MARAVFPHTGRAWVVGVTGAPGAGKSTIIDGLVRSLREAGERVAVVAVDPSSPLSGGAFLGDRIRVQRHATDPGVFLRSMASRGQQGGLARATLGALRVLDAAGWPWVIVETAGAGQVEVDVAEAVDTTLVTVTPGWGDAIQAAKAGLLEVADAFVLNKADLPGAEEVARHLEFLLEPTAGVDDGWVPPVVRTVATTAAGVSEIVSVIGRHRAFLSRDDRLARRRAQRLRSEVRHLAAAYLVREAAERWEGAAFERLARQVEDRRLDPLSAAQALLGYSGNTPADRPQSLQ